MDHKERIDTLTVPYKVIREAALNILIHRVWWSDSDVLSVAIFDDRVEFANPGAFPPGTSPETFYKRPQSKPVNKLISEVFFKSGLMEAWGRGIPDIFDLCKENGLPKPEFELAHGFVYLTIRFAKPLTPRLSGDTENDREGDRENDREKPLVLTSRQVSMLSLMKENDRVTTEQLKEKLHTSISTVNREIAALKKAKALEREGGDKDGKWVVLV